MISVCIATYNGEKYIKEQLDSILCQLSMVDEVVLSDDNSSDSTLDIIQNYNDNRIKIFKNKGKGLIENFENALLNSSGDYIFLSDQDDIWEENKIKECLNDFEKGYQLILSDCSVFDSESKAVIHNSFFEFNKSKKGIMNNIINNSYIGCCMAFKKDLKDKILPFPKNIPMHDSWIGIIGELFFKVSFNKNKLIKYRLHSKNASYTGVGKSKYSFFEKISFRIFLSFVLFQKFFFGK
ncbi:glycosyltransferase family 2 protein [Flavobacterium sp. MC2016-06]|jgi:glycosyltransferase involved in cell wall biosynthesis|uniref:glycosyltransferase family 2 protein n=1 Tax=Flavobacterium sp. MC2016-06 TaxID=2676308 RepID=UPI0012BA8B6F|nr:glycosyltransferase family 2 protein [Flavobacterium sp. MC2016-06]MBU3858647.1 glycosyltransferase family 2 protein [Flavobacterium sp. MC2016-06]